MKAKKVEFLQRVSSLSSLPFEELKTKDLQTLADTVILPIILRPGGLDIRGWRIPDVYMTLMADFGKEIRDENWFIGDILLELALQRLSCGAVVHELTSFDVLPDHYKFYSAKRDQQGLMSDACWSFLTKQINTCLSGDIKTKEHAEKIVLGLLTHIDDSGKPIGSFMLDNSGFHVSGEEVIAWAKEIAFNKLPFKAIYEALATPENWERFSWWFGSNWKQIDQKDFFTRIQVKGFFAKRKIKKQILSR